MVGHNRTGPTCPLNTYTLYNCWLRCGRGAHVAELIKRGFKLSRLYFEVREDLALCSLVKVK